MTVSENNLFEFGTLIGLHGLRGDLKVKPLVLASDELVHARAVYLRAKTGVVKRYTPARVVPHKGNVLLQLEGVDSAEQAQGLVGMVVLMPVSDLPVLPVGEYRWHQLNGLTVVDRRCGELGVLDGMFTTAAHDIYEVHGRFGEVLIPAVSAFILAVDLEAKRIQVDLPEGLIPEPDEN